jgi:hypothetical protein
MSVTASTNFGNGWSPWLCPVALILAQAYSMANPQLTGYNDGFLESLASPDNMANGPIKLDSFGENQIRIAYKQRRLASTVSTTPVSACSTQTSDVLKEDLLTVDKYVSSGWSLTVSEYAKFCEEIATAINNVNNVFAGLNQPPVSTPADLNRVRASAPALMALISSMPFTYHNINSFIECQNRLRHKMNIGLVQELYASFVGGFAAPNQSASPLAVNIVTAANGSLVQGGFGRINFEYKKAQQSGMPIIVGFNNVEIALSSMTNYCCNTVGSGAGDMVTLDPNRRAGTFMMHYYADQAIPDTANGASTTEDFIVYSPGALKMFTRNEWTGARAKTWGDGVTLGTVADVRVPGLEWDFAVREEGCTEKITFNMGVAYALWGLLPGTAYATGDVLEDVNGVFHFTAVAI